MFPRHCLGNSRRCSLNQLAICTAQGLISHCEQPGVLLRLVFSLSGDTTRSQIAFFFPSSAPPTSSLRPDPLHYPFRPPPFSHNYTKQPGGANITMAAHAIFLRVPEIIISSRDYSSRASPVGRGSATNRRLDPDIDPTASSQQQRSRLSRMFYRA